MMYKVRVLARARAPREARCQTQRGDGAPRENRTGERSGERFTERLQNFKL